MLHPSFIDLDTSHIICTYIVIEALILAVVLIILSKTDMLVSWKLIAYYIIVLGGSRAFNFLLSSLKIHVGDPKQANLLHFSVLSIFMILVFLNITLSKIIFAINFRKACLVGTLMGLINTIMVIITTTFYK
jgi:hypothetical protein